MSSFGQMEESKRDIGKKANNMEKIIMRLIKEILEEDSRKTEKDLKKYF